MKPEIKKAIKNDFEAMVTLPNIFSLLSNKKTENIDSGIS